MAPNEIEVHAYFPDAQLPDYARNWAAERCRQYRYFQVFTWVGTDEEIVDGLLKAKQVVARVERGELCSCNHHLTMPNARLCSCCAFFRHTLIYYNSCR